MTINYLCTWMIVGAALRGRLNCTSFVREGWPQSATPTIIQVRGKKMKDNLFPQSKNQRWSWSKFLSAPVNTLRLCVSLGLFRTIGELSPSRRTPKGEASVARQRLLLVAPVARHR